MNSSPVIPTRNVVTSQMRTVAVWLFVVAVMILLMVVLGGVTRLTHSGLSMVEWKPVTGWLPPLSEAAWMDAFDKYKAYPQYQKLNLGMSLEEFKSIFWPEFLHRLWGRIIGVAFFLPFVFFIIKGWIKGLLARRLFIIFIIGALQGGMGWFMVKSGMVDRPDVSQYRLTAHLGLAIVLYGYILWAALGVLGKGMAGPQLDPRLPRRAMALLGLVFITILSGGFVAGLDAGFTYNTFPLMDGDWVPEGILEVSPIYLNPFENLIMVQFNHRVLAITVLILSVALWHWVRRVKPSTESLVAANMMLACVVLQVTLGILTLLLVVPVPIAAAHQAVAVIVFGAIIWVVRELRPCDSTK